MKGKSDNSLPFFLIVTGLSGAGKSTAIKMLEDMGYYCVDNLPLSLMETFAQLCLTSSQPMDKVALGIDIREGDSLRDLPLVIGKIESQGIQVEVLFLEAQREDLMKRFKETRRPHPLKNGTLEESMEREKAIMEPLRSMARYVLDTSPMTPHTLKATLLDLFGERREDMPVFIYSFGFKHGPPSQLDLMLDVRFLPNPHFINGLREKTGLDEGVRDYVLNQEETKRFLCHLEAFLSYLLPLYRKEGKPFLSLGVGCTGGVHRSVVISEWLARRLENQGHRVKVKHKELTP